MILGLAACASKTTEQTSAAASTSAASTTSTSAAASASASTSASTSATAATGSVYYLNFKPESDEAWQKIAADYTAQTGVPVKVVTAASGTYDDTLTAEMDKSSAPTMKELLKKEPSVTAVFAMADVIAIGAIRALYDEGLRVPDDISVIGYDGLKIGGFFLPKLSTITQSVELLAGRSFELMNTASAGKFSSDRTIRQYAEEIWKI